MTRYAAYMVLLLLPIGCVEPPYRTEVTPNGQGGVDVQRVPKDPPSESASTPSTPAAVDDRISALEAQQRATNAEIERLKALKAQPTTQP